MSVVTEELLYEFCNQSSPIMAHPFKMEDGRICVSDGRVLVIFDKGVINNDYISSSLETTILNNIFPIVDMNLTLEPIILDKEPEFINCKDCDGTGKIILCPECNGEGLVSSEYVGKYSDAEDEITCPLCKGKCTVDSNIIPLHNLDSTDVTCIDCDCVCGKVYKPDTVKIGELYFDLMQVHRINTHLKDVTFSICNDPNHSGPILFKHNDGIGILMKARI